MLLSHKFSTLKEFVNAMELAEYLFQIRIENTLPFSKILGPLITLFIPILLGTLCENNIPWFQFNMEN